MTLPLDEALSRVVIDISGRPYLVFRTAFHASKIGSFDTQLVEEWFRAFAMQAGLTLHVETFYGANDHHIAESCFKALARALRLAVAVVYRQPKACSKPDGGSNGHLQCLLAA